MNTTLRKNLMPFYMPEVILVLGMLYNAMLAIANAHMFSINTPIVAAAEMLIVLMGCGVIALRYKEIRNIKPPVLFAYTFFVIFIGVSIMNEFVFVKGFRDMLLIAVFILLGCLSKEQNLIRAFRFLAALIFVFAVIEGYLTDTYVSIFEPASYFVNTRGVGEAEYNNSGLFANSLGFKGRFSFGIFDTHRLSSVFLEQVSLANFCIILALFTSAFWTKLKWHDRILFIATILFCVLANNSRTASILIVAITFGHFIFPYLPRYTNVLYMPAILLLSALLFYDPAYSGELMDNFQGRIGHTVHMLASMDLASLLGANIHATAETADSGYAYLIYTQTIIGLILFWLFVSMITDQTTKAGKRYANGFSVYVFTNLLIGAAILSIKVSAPAFLIAGYFYQNKTVPEEEQISQNRNTNAASSI